MRHLISCVDIGLQIILATSVPKTFGIKYGCIVFSIIQISRIIVGLIVVLTPENRLSQFLLSLLSSLVAAFICIFFRETLDVANLYKRKLIIF